MENKILEQQQPRTIRADQTTYDRFKELSATNYNNQGQALAALINLYETEQGKTLIPERKKEIENYQMHLSALSEMFVTSLQLNADAEMRVRNEFETQLTSKDKTIVTLQKQIDTAKLKTDEATNSLSAIQDNLRQTTLAFMECKKENTSLTTDQEAMASSYMQQLADKDKLIKALEEKNTENEKLIVGLAGERDKMMDIAGQHEQLEKELHKLQDKLNTQIHDNDTNAKVAEYEKAKALLEQRQISQEEKEQLQNSYHGELKDYLQTISNLQERIADCQNTQNKMAQEKKDLENTLSQAQQEIEILRNKLTNEEETPRK